MICLTNTTITLHWLQLSYGLIVVATGMLATGMERYWSLSDDRY